MSGSGPARARRAAVVRACVVVAGLWLALLLGAPAANAHPVVLFTDPSA
ncbi:MAG: hypothetical protein ACRDQF_09655 [Thermocrispum sp.]